MIQDTYSIYNTELNTESVFVIMCFFLSSSEPVSMFKWYHGVYNCHLQCCVGLCKAHMLPRCCWMHFKNVHIMIIVCRCVRFKIIYIRSHPCLSVCICVRRMRVAKGHWCDFLWQCVYVLRRVPVCVCACVAGGHGLCSLWHWYTALKLLGWAAVGLRHRHTWEMTFYEWRKWRRVQDSITGAEMMHVNRTSLLTCSGPYSDLETPQSAHTHTHTRILESSCFPR